ncbi:hypothetical protein [Dyadobacter sandarakinus]|uniref:Uncharacterized protein n=1 Tax=Dyadobacter sandarakinus TaxID=2747268 RepID=A0ABX7I2J6_9BACT|nr:hypothetical protein [Dyadobacter sandarakinus]QRQ99741.1 hypothetical protein HWI92_01815 [Dyadobacter sandarakinus]
MEEKEEYIKSAYGASYEAVKDFLQYGSWVHEDDLTPDMAEYEGKVEWLASSHWRPECLAGVDENNGWVRFNQRHPENGAKIYALLNEYFERRYWEELTFIDSRKQYILDRYSHWRKVEKIEYPLY